MRLACVAIGLFCAGFLAHWIVWRIRVPRRQSATILLIMLLALPVGLATVAIVPALYPYAPRWPWEVLHLAEFHIAMTLAYIVAYSALEQRSPSMTILSHVARVGTAGRTREELEELLRSNRPVEVRFESLVRDGLMHEVDGSYHLTTKGRRWAWLFLQWRQLLKLEKGG
jgi:hypothetical protein